MRLTYTKCHECIYEAILADKPDYTMEPYGKMPIWGEYREKAPTKLCVEAGDIEYEAICLEHLIAQGIEK